MAKRYRVKEDVRIETNTPTDGRYTRNFQAGEVSPRSEQDEFVLDALVEIGQAEVVVAEPKSKKEPK